MVCPVFVTFATQTFVFLYSDPIKSQKANESGLLDHIPQLEPHSELTEAHLRAKVAADPSPGPHTDLPPSSAATLETKTPSPGPRRPLLHRFYSQTCGCVSLCLHGDLPHSATWATQPQHSVKTRDWDFKDLQDYPSQQHEITL